MQQFVTVQKLAENRWEIFSITTDISDLKRVETELRESQALYHSLVEQMPAGISARTPKTLCLRQFHVLAGLKNVAGSVFGKTALELS